MSSPFDTEDARFLNHARRTFLESFLSDIARVEGLTTAVDVGCGALGVFTRALREAGLSPIGMDARSENVFEAKHRNADIEFLVQDVEDKALSTHGPFDLVLCFGLLYHLENPFLAVRNLHRITRKYILIETQIAPLRGMSAALYEEYPSRNQSMHYVAFMLNESAVVKMLYKAGYRSVYRVLQPPEHWQFRRSLGFHRIRTVLLASNLDGPVRRRRWGDVEFEPVSEPSPALLSLANWETVLGKTFRQFRDLATKISRRLEAIKAPGNIGER